MCKKCKICFDSLWDLTKHKKAVHEEENPFKCDTCGEKFASKYRLKKHTHLIHEGNKFVCKICEAEFADWTNMTRHIRQVHGAKKSHQCNNCGLTFVNKQVLSNHISTAHDMEKPFTCEICEKKFATQNILNGHIVSVHQGKKLHQCNTCGKSFASAQILCRHKRVVHEGKKPYKCQKCELWFDFQFEWKKHRIEVHERENLSNINLPLQAEESSLVRPWAEHGVQENSQILSGVEVECNLDVTNTSRIKVPPIDQTNELLQTNVATVHEEKHPYSRENHIEKESGTEQTKFLYGAEIWLSV